MRLAFIDDSEQTRPVRAGVGKLMALGCIIVPESEVSALGKSIIRDCREHGVPEGEEMKWNPPKGSYLKSAGGEVVAGLRKRLLWSAIAHQVVSVVVIIDTGSVYRGKSRDEIGQILLKWLYERISMCLAASGERCIVIADKPGGGAKEEGNWLAKTLELTQNGTEYIQPDRVMMPIVTAPSHHVPHLQLADLVVAATTAAVAGHQQAVEMGPLLAKIAHRNAFGLVGGAGIVMYPRNELANLLHWVFAEDSFARVSMNSGVTLPWSEWRYAKGPEKP